MSHPESEAQRQDVDNVLGELGLDRASHPILEAHNKIDLVERLGLSLAGPQAGDSDGPEAVRVSALTGEGIDRLLGAIEDRLARGRSLIELTLDPSDGRGLHWLYEHAEVMSRSDRDDGLHLTVRVAPDQVERVNRRFAAAGAASVQTRARRQRTAP